MPSRYPLAQPDQYFKPRHLVHGNSVELSQFTAVGREECPIGIRCRASSPFQHRRCWSFESNSSPCLVPPVLTIRNTMVRFTTFLAILLVIWAIWLIPQPLPVTGFPRLSFRSLFLQ